MSFIKKGTPVNAVPSLKVEGYLDAMNGREIRRAEDEVYMSGYNLGLAVKKGEEEKPTWA